MAKKPLEGHMTNDGYVPIQKGFMLAAGGFGQVQGGYIPTTGQGPVSAPSAVPKQPSSVQPPKNND